MAKDDGRFTRQARPSHSPAAADRACACSSIRPRRSTSRRCNMPRCMPSTINPGIDQTALCNTIALDRSTIGDVVGRLEKKGLITRRNGSARPAHQIAAHHRGGPPSARDIEPAVESTQRLILAPLKPSQRTAFMRMLKHLVISTTNTAGRRCGRKRAEGHRIPGAAQHEVRCAADPGSSRGRSSCAEMTTTPDQRCTASRCIASGEQVANPWRADRLPTGFAPWPAFPDARRRRSGWRRPPRSSPRRSPPWCRLRRRP